MAVLKIVPKLYQEKISEKLKEEISLVTNGEAKYYNRLYKFFQYTDIPVSYTHLTLPTIA